jgi:hypothetical protein
METPESRLLRLRTTLALGQFQSFSLLIALRELARAPKEELIELTLLTAHAWRRLHIRWESNAGFGGWAVVRAIVQIVSFDM